MVPSLKLSKSGRPLPRFRRLVARRRAKRLLARRSDEGEPGPFIAALRRSVKRTRGAVVESRPVLEIAIRECETISPRREFENTSKPTLTRWDSIPDRSFGRTNRLCTRTSGSTHPPGRRAAPPASAGCRFFHGCAERETVGPLMPARSSFSALARMDRPPSEESGADRGAIEVSER